MSHEWMHAACLTIAETGEMWGENVTPSAAMEAVYKLKTERDALLAVCKTVLDQFGEWEGPEEPETSEAANSRNKSVRAYEAVRAAVALTVR